jgi:tyrosyl-tRNA synthetase
LLTQNSNIFPSKGEARKMIQANGFSLNKEKYMNFDGTITADDLLHGKFLLAQKGKKNYFVIEAV